MGEKNRQFHLILFYFLKKGFKSPQFCLPYDDDDGGGFGFYTFIFLISSNLAKYTCGLIATWVIISQNWKKQKNWVQLGELWLYWVHHNLVWLHCKIRRKKRVNICYFKIKIMQLFILFVPILWCSHTSAINHKRN